MEPLRRDHGSPVAARCRRAVRNACQAYQQDGFVDRGEKKGSSSMPWWMPIWVRSTKLSLAQLSTRRRDGHLPIGTTEPGPAGRARPPAPIEFWNTTVSGFATLTRTIWAGNGHRGDLGYHKGAGGIATAQWLDGVPTGLPAPAWPPPIGSGRSRTEQQHQANGPFSLLGGEHDLAIGAMVNRLTDGWTNRNPAAMDPIADFNHWDRSLPARRGRAIFPAGLHHPETLTRISLFGPLKVIGGGRLSISGETGAAGTNSAYRLSYKGVLTPMPELVPRLTSLSPMRVYQDLQAAGQCPRPRRAAAQSARGKNYEAGLKALLLGDGYSSDRGRVG